jgi:hypothetical protein
MNAHELVRFISTIFAALSLVTSVSAQTVYSVNALGYVDVNLGAGSNFVANPLAATDNTVSNLFRGLPDGSTLQIWEWLTQSFGPTNRFSAATGWTDPAARFVQPQGGLLWLPLPKQLNYVGEVYQQRMTNQYYQAGAWVLGAMPNFVRCGDFTQCPPNNPPFGTEFYKWTGSFFAHYVFVFPSPESPSGWYTPFGDPANPRLEHGEAGLFFVPDPFALPVPIDGNAGAGAHGVELRGPRKQGGELSFQFAAVSNAPYAVLRSTNLAEEIWPSVQEGNAAATGGVATITVSNATDAVAFYRLRPPVGASDPILFDGVRETNRFRFQFSAPGSGTYHVERTTSPSYPPVWQPLQTFTLGGKGVVNVTDTNAVAAKGYYRVRVDN